MDQKPSVFPTPEQRAEAARHAELAKIIAYEKAKEQEANMIYQTSQAPSDTPYGHVDAVEMMKRRTQQQMEMRNQTGRYDGVVQHPELAEKPTGAVVYQQQHGNKNEELMRARDEQLRKNQEQIDSYQRQANEAAARNNANPNAGLYPQQDMPQNNNNYQGTNSNAYSNNQNVMGSQNNYVPPTPPSKPPVNNGYGENFGPNPSNINSYIFELSQPNYNSPFDVLPLPSEGKLYRTKKPNINVGYMTTADENILTSPNLLESGEFLNILINRKILEPALRYKDLHVGDRNAIMIWLRATAYGEMYPVTLFDENDIPFETEINLNELQTKKLGAEPDEEGLFDFQFPLCKAVVKFKLMTCGDIDDIEKKVESDKLAGLPINNTNIYTLERTIVEVNGDRNKETIKAFSNSIRVNDYKKFSEYIDTIESGIDLNIEVRTPGGGSVKTFLPLNINFFWPNVKL